MKTLEDQFGKLKLIKPHPYSEALRECYEINNYIALRVLKYIVTNECKLERRDNLDSDNWKPGTLREFVRFLTMGKEDEVQQFDNWTLRFWRIKTKPTYQEVESLIRIKNNEED